MERAVVLMMLVLIRSLAAMPDRAGCDVKIDINPEKTVALLDTNVTITCDVVTDVKGLLQISISKDEYDPFVILGQGSDNITYDTKNGRHYQAKGDIDENAARKYLSVEFRQPTYKDSGAYSCVVLYFDKVSSVIRQCRASSNLVIESNFENSTLDIVLSSLVKRVSSLEKDRLHRRHQMSKLSEKNLVMAKNINDFEEKTTKEINGLKDYVGDMWAFSATSTKGSFTRGNNLIFPKLTMQVGQGYNVETGVVTAPTDGLYLFNLQGKMILRRKLMACDKGWTLFPGSDSCVKLFKERKSWHDARASCKRHRADLVTIRSQGFTKFLHDDILVKGSPSVWIGAVRNHANHQFVWVRGDPQITYSNWSPGQPDYHQGKENCGELRAHFGLLWNDGVCGVSQHYMCQKSGAERVEDCKSKSPVDLKVNGRVLAKLPAYDHKGLDISADSYIITLKAGEKVMPMMTDSPCDVLLINQPSMFTGHLIQSF